MCHPQFCMSVKRTIKSLMASHSLYTFSSTPVYKSSIIREIREYHIGIGRRLRCPNLVGSKLLVQCSETLRTCKNCKTQFDTLLNHPLACRYHTAHFGGETKRKFESVHTGGTMDTPDSGKVLQYWHCCGSEDPFHPGCTAAPHSSYDDS